MLLVLLIQIISAQTDSKDCVFNPTNPNCVDFNLPNVDSILFNSCLNSHSFSCQFFKFCQSSISESCNSWNLYLNYCVNSLNYSDYCRPFYSLCRPNSLVSACKVESLFPSDAEICCLLNSLKIKPKLLISCDCVNLVTETGLVIYRKKKMLFYLVEFLINLDVLLDLLELVLELFFLLCIKKLFHLVWLL